MGDVRNYASEVEVIVDTPEKVGVYNFEGDKEGNNLTMVRRKEISCVKGKCLC